MVDAEEAKKIVLRLSEATSEGSERFAIQSCTLSTRGDYWIICANSEDFVLRGILERCYVGVSGHLVNVISGEIETVGSGQSVERYLEDRYDLLDAKGGHYVLSPSFDFSDKANITRLRQKIECTLPVAIQLASTAYRCWLTGRRSTLKNAQTLLDGEEIITTIELHSHAEGAVAIGQSDLRWDALKTALISRAALTHK